MMSCFHVFFIVALLDLQSYTNAYDHCQEDVVFKSAEYVPSCPTSKIRWDKAASEKKCGEKARQQNCTSKIYEYHCVINEYANATLEVCAPPKIILGHCTEFNAVGRLIQNQFSAVCNDTFPICDKHYSSTDAYKYQDCYQLVKRTEITPSIPTCFKTFRGADSRDVIIIALTVVCSILIAFVIVIAVRNIYKSRRRNESGDDCKENDIVPLSPKDQQINYGSAL